MENNIFTIIVTFNGEKWIDECINSLIQSKIETTIIIIDNCSTDKTISIVTDNFPNIIFLQQKENLGFGQANNIGISYALQHNASAVFLLNQDAKIDSDTIKNLNILSIKNPSFGILSPLQLNWKGSELEYYFNNFISKNTKIIADIVLNKNNKTIYEIPFVNAAAWYIPIQCLKKIGGFDSIFFHYGEDNNYCQRILFHKLKIGIVMNSKIYHDAKIRKEPKNYIFSKFYYQNEINNYLIKYCDINNDYSSRDLKKVKLHILKLIIVNILKFKWKFINGYYKKYMIFKKYDISIFNSRNRNKKEGLHYLDLSNK